MESFHQCKEDVWSIACIIVEMMINTILFRPQNDDPALQLLCIAQLVGGLTPSLIDRFPAYVKPFFSNMKCDIHQQRLPRLLKQIFHQYVNHANQYNHPQKDSLYDLLKQMLQFQIEKRIDLQTLIEHPFFALNSNNKIRSTDLKINATSIQIADLVHLCTKLNLQQTRWILTLKERCLFELILHIEDFNQFNLKQCGLSQSLQNELKQLIYFLTGNQ